MAATLAAAGAHARHSASGVWASCPKSKMRGRTPPPPANVAAPPAAPAKVATWQRAARDGASRGSAEAAAVASATPASAGGTAYARQATHGGRRPGRQGKGSHERRASQRREVDHLRLCQQEAEAWVTKRQEERDKKDSSIRARAG
jgi:hypothetical protein